MTPGELWFIFGKHRSRQNEQLATHDTCPLLSHHYFFLEIAPSIWQVPVLSSLCIQILFIFKELAQPPSLLWIWLWTSSPKAFSPFLISQSILSINLLWNFKASALYNNHLCIFLIMYPRDLQFLKGMILSILCSIYHIIQCLT